MLKNKNKPSTEATGFNWQIVGHRNVLSYLQGNLSAGKSSHAYLFFGPKHVGKNTVAEFFVTSLVCEKLPSHQGPTPCYECKCCQQAKNRIHPDILWVSRTVDQKTGKLKKNIGIEQIRDLQNRLSLHSFLNSHKVAVITEAESLSLEAANSLLKMLEEPSPKTVIILIASDLFTIPKTIVSRCQLLRFLPVSTDEIYHHLVSLGAETKKARTLAALSYGRPGIAIDYFTNEDNFLDYQEKVKNFIALHKSDLIERFKTIEEISRFPDSNLAREVLDVWSKVVRDILLTKKNRSELTNHLNFHNDLEQLVSLYNDKQILAVLGDVALAKKYLAANVNPRLILENLILNLPAYSKAAG